MSTRFYNDNRVVFTVAFLLVSLVPAFVYVFLNPDNKAPIQETNRNDSQEDVKGIFDISIYPQIIDTPTTAAKVGSKYDYTLKASDSDTDQNKLSYKLKEGPSWLHLHFNNIYGTPTINDIGTYTVVVTINDGQHSTDKLFYIIVGE